MGFLHNAFELGLLAVLLCVFKLIERRLTSGRAMQSPLRCDLGSVSAGARMMQPNLAPTDVSLIECRTVVSVVDLAPAYISRLTRAPVVHVCSPTRRLLTSGRAALLRRLSKCRRTYGAAKLGALAPVLFTVTSAWPRAPVVHGCCRLGAY